MGSKCFILDKEEIIMAENENGTYIDFEICDWWVDWYRNEKDKNFFCAVVRVGEQKYYIERELSAT